MGIFDNGGRRIQNTSESLSRDAVNWLDDRIDQIEEERNYRTHRVNESTEALDKARAAHERGEVPHQAVLDAIQAYKDSLDS